MQQLSQQLPQWLSAQPSGHATACVLSLYTQLVYSAYILSLCIQLMYSACILEKACRKDDTGVIQEAKAEQAHSRAANAFGLYCVAALISGVVGMVSVVLAWQLPCCFLTRRRSVLSLFYASPACVSCPSCGLFIPPRRQKTAQEARLATGRLSGRECRHAQAAAGWSL